MNAAIYINKISKRFILNKSPNTLKEWLIFRPNETREKEFWALKNISFTVKKGECIGILGGNGSGKSTLLKIISRILYPTNGSVEVNGKIFSLLELGSGFKPDYTGMENIYLNGSIMGFTKKEINEKLNSIIEFAELEQYIDQPVRNYSSGMYMRLAYSIAVSSNPDILLIDEVLAVGDQKFKEKGLNRILELKDQGATIVFVSHSEGMVRKVCDRAVWLNKGTMIMDGNIAEVMDKYKEGV